MDVATSVVSIVGALISGGGGGYVITAIARHRTGPAEVTVRLTDAAMKQVDQLQEQVTSAERKAGRLEARLDLAVDEANQLRGQVREMDGQVRRMSDRLRVLTEAIHDPTTTLQRLRQMVPLAGPNGGGAA